MISMADEKRFVKTYTQSGLTGNLMQIWVDRETEKEGKQFVIQPDKALFLRLK